MDFARPLPLHARQARACPHPRRRRDGLRRCRRGALADVGVMVAGYQMLTSTNSRGTFDPFQERVRGSLGSVDGDELLARMTDSAPLFRIREFDKRGAEGGGIVLTHQPSCAAFHSPFGTAMLVVPLFLHWDPDRGHSVVQKLACGIVSDRGNRAIESGPAFCEGPVSKPRHIWHLRPGLIVLPEWSARARKVELRKGGRLLQHPLQSLGVIEIPAASETHINERAIAWQAKPVACFVAAEGLAP